MHTRFEFHNESLFHIIVRCGFSKKAFGQCTSIDLSEYILIYAQILILKRKSPAKHSPRVYLDKSRISNNLFFQACSVSPR